MVAFTRFIGFLCKTAQEKPGVISEIIGIISLKPSAIGRNDEFTNTFFTTKSLIAHDILANFGLWFFSFLIGLEHHLIFVKCTAHKALHIVLCGWHSWNCMGIWWHYILTFPLLLPFVLLPTITCIVSSFSLGKTTLTPLEVWWYCTLPHFKCLWRLKPPQINYKTATNILNGAKCNIIKPQGG